MQVDPTKPKLKPPGGNLLKPKCDIMLSNFAFKFHLRRYTKAAETEAEGLRAALVAAAAALKEARAKETTNEYTTRMELETTRASMAAAKREVAVAAGTYTRSLFSST